MKTINGYTNLAVVAGLSRWSDPFGAVMTNAVAMNIRETYICSAGMARRKLLLAADSNLMCLHSLSRAKAATRSMGALCDNREIAS